MIEEFPSLSLNDTTLTVLWLMDLVLMSWDDNSNSYRYKKIYYYFSLLDIAINAGISTESPCCLCSLYIAIPVVVGPSNLSYLGSVHAVVQVISSKGLCYLSLVHIADHFYVNVIDGTITIFLYWVQCHYCVIHEEWYMDRSGGDWLMMVKQFRQK